MIYLVGSRGIPARYGGFETLVEKVHDHFVESGHEVRVIGTRDVGITRSLPGRLVSRPPLQSLETPLLTWFGRPKVTSDDHVLVVNPINVWTAKRISRDGARVWLHMDGMEHERRKWGAIARYGHRKARRTAARSNLGLIVDSHAIGRILHDDFGASSTCIGYGGCEVAETEPRHRWKAEASSNTYLVLGRPEPENNILEICRAFSAADLDARLLVVGAPQRPTRYWRHVIDIARGNPKIELSGPKWDRTELCNLYQTIRAVIHGHSVGGTNPALVDALSHGSPVLAHDNPFNRETGSTCVEYWGDEASLTRLLRDCHEIGFKPSGLPSGSHLNWRDVTKAYRSALGMA
jgi:glycosyltransferase involved in cell wall biosynthesis